VEKKSESPKIPSWLQNLQENSWELELLISGGAVFSLIQFPEILNDWLLVVRVMTSFPGYSAILIVSLIGIKILTHGFILHLFLRSYWLALVCLNYVFPQGIATGRRPVAFPFNTRHQEGDLQDQIMKVDRYCGTVIYSSIISAFILFGLLIIFGVYIGIHFLFADYEDIGLFGQILEGFYWYSTVSINLYFLDLILLGAIRRIPYLSFLLYPSFSLFDLLSIRPFYERALVFFASNIRKTSFYIGALIFAALTFCSVYLSVNRLLGWRNFFDSRNYVWSMNSENSKADFSFRLYDDESERSDRRHVSIPSKIIQTNFLPVNIRYSKGMDEIIEAVEPIDSLRTLAGIVQLSIDDSVYKEVVWNNNWEISMAESGISAIIPIGHLTNGQHILKVYPKKKQNRTNKEIDLSGSNVEFKIPFWKDVR
jgi:hypothetical protein